MHLLKQSLAIHSKRRHEKFVISAERRSETEYDSKSFIFLSSKNKITRHNQVSSNEMYVQNVPPLITFLFGVVVFLLLPEILNLLF